MEAIMSHTYSTDVLICGAGAAGLTLAIDLARRGISFRLIDKIDVPFQGARGKAIQPRSQEVFEDLGIVDRVVAAGGPYPPQRGYRDDGSYQESPIMEQRDPTPNEPYAIAIMVPQFLTEAAMRDRLAELGQRPQFGVELTGFAQDAEGVSASISGPDGVASLRSRYLVGADGGGSFVRRTLDVGFPGKSLDIRAIVADVFVEGLDRDAWHRFNDGTPNQISLCPLRGTDLFQLQALIPLQGDIDLSTEGMADMVTRRTGRNDILIRSVVWISAYNMHARLADRFQVGRVFLAGDAAHVHPPTGGQGLNTSVQDCYNLGWKLAAVLSGAPERLLASYDGERRPIAAAMLGLSMKLLDELKKPGGMRRGRETQQLDLGYSQSTLSLEKPPRISGVRAGHRAPDAPIRGAAGAPTRLFNLFRGPHWTLLGYEVDRLTVVRPRTGLHIHMFGQGGDIIDEGGHVRDGYGLEPGTWVLIRPDGYVAAIVASEERRALECYLAAVGLGGGGAERGDANPADATRTTGID
jgi:2-polyprenyl-6-methoxyphenol hydroxylase-like FAD-dependent oxidoreductase